ncbi:hypothetical protein CVT25_002189 [Psilocybe cyanescens]|uniref:Protein kinase domain-containing protein n=1 Tax=Psilocybe cyanescens TaxID=93625 RepID=A0A409XF81_PSICY|nr:hypothetical protein CVT25_002189 [Psilocybe cyanescens]
MTQFKPAAINSRLTKGRLTQAEIFWRTHQPWLIEQGYELRVRYRPEWIPSWLKSDSLPDRFEDGQILPGLQFMHQHRVAHRDICVQNLMIDAHDLYPKGYHFVRKNKSLNFKGRAQYHTRTQKPAKYYIIGYELARSYKADNKENLEPPVYNLTSPASCFRLDSEDSPDPFATDVFYIGNMIRYYFLDGHTSPLRARARRGKLEFMRPMINAMVHEDYTKRPTMTQIVCHFEDLVKDLSGFTLRSRFSRPQDGALAAVLYSIPHWMRKISYIVRRVPAIPTPQVTVQKQDKGIYIGPVKVSLLPSTVPNKPSMR